MVQPQESEQHSEPPTVDVIDVHVPAGADLLSDVDADAAGVEVISVSRGSEVSSVQQVEEGCQLENLVHAYIQLALEKDPNISELPRIAGVDEEVWNKKFAELKLAQATQAEAEGGPRVSEVEVEASQEATCTKETTKSIAEAATTKKMRLLAVLVVLVVLAHTVLYSIFSICC